MHCILIVPVIAGISDIPIIKKWNLDEQLIALP